MIFRPGLAREVVAGRKTQTRRPVKPGEAECRYHVGRTYAVQDGRGKPAMARIQILGVKRQRLDAIGQLDALAEGFETRQAFFDYWRDLYRQRPDVDLGQPVWAIAFRLYQKAAEAAA